MLRYQLQQTWRTKRLKTVVIHELESPPQPPKNDFTEDRSKRNSILKLENFIKACVLCEFKEEEKTM